MTQVVELSGDEAKLLRSLQNVIDKQLQLERKLRDTAEQGDAAGTAMEDALRKVNAEADKTLVGLMRDLKSLGPDGQAAADALKGHLVDAGKAGFKSIDTILDQIRLIDPAAAEAAQSARDSLATAAQETVDEFGETLAALRALGPEGSAAAAQIKSDMEAAAAATKGNFQELLGKLAELDPTAAESAAAIRAEMERAANDTEAQFRQVLQELSSLGPEGRKAADEIKKNLVQAGKISEKSMSDVAEKLREIDPAAADIADKVIASFGRVEQQSNPIFSSISKFAISELSGIIAAYVGISEAIQSVNSFVSEQRDLINQSREAHIALARIQQESYKNLVGISMVEQDKLLQRGVGEVAKVGIGLGPATEAVTNAMAAGATSSEDAIAAAKAAAMLNILTPQQTAAATGAAVSLGQAMGGATPQEALNLALTAAGPSAVVDPAKAAQTLSVAVPNVVNQMKDADRRRAAKEAAALFSVMTVEGKDMQGDSSVTAATAFAGQLREFYKDAGVEDPGTLSGRIGLLQKDEQLRAKFLKDLTGEQRFKVGMEQLVTGGSETAARFQNFTSVIETQGTAAYDEKLKEAANATSQVATAVFNQQMRASIEAMQHANTEGATHAQIRESMAEALPKLRTSGVQGYFDYLSEAPDRMGSNASDAAMKAISTLLYHQAILKQDGIQAGDRDKLTAISDQIEKIFGYIEKQADRGALDADGARTTARRARREQQSNAAVGADPVYEMAYGRLAEILERIATSNEAMVKPAEETAEATKESKNKLSPLRLPGHNSTNTAELLTPSVVEKLSQVEP